MCKMIISPGLFFHFFKILIFRVFRGIKGQKMVQNDIKLSLSCSIYQEPYIKWLSFMVHMCKMIISPGVFFQFFKILIFQVVRDCRRAKNCPKWQKLLSVALYISGTIHHMTVIYATHMLNDNIFRCFLHFFQNFDFLDP